MPAFFKWKLAQRSSSSSGLSFINASRLSPSSSNAARAVKDEMLGQEQDKEIQTFYHSVTRNESSRNAWLCVPYLRCGSAVYPQTVLSWWSARGGREPGEASPPLGPERRCWRLGTRWLKLSSEPSSGSPITPKSGRTHCFIQLVRRFAWLCIWESYLRGEGSEFLFVNSPFIDGVRNRQVDEFTAATNQREWYQGLEARTKVYREERKGWFNCTKVRCRLPQL